MDVRADLIALCRASGVHVDVEQILRAWDEPHRVYHTRRQLADVLVASDRLRQSRAAAARRTGAAVDPFAVRWAAYYHDIVYRTDDSASEEASAVWLERDLPAGPMRDQAARLIRMTADHRYDEDDVAAAWLSDADLMVLAGDRYEQYVERVRAEFAHVPEALWRKGRGQVLDGLLATEQLFMLAGPDVETAARRNLTAERTALAG